MHHFIGDDCELMTIFADVLCPNIKHIKSLRDDDWSNYFNIQQPCVA